MKGKDKKEAVNNKEEFTESWCFVCKDGGELRICDHEKCLKCFHPGCVEKDDSFLESEIRWECARHTCYACHRSSYHHCYTCTKAVCRHCYPTSDFYQIKGNYGFCKFCLKVVLLIEENTGYNSDGEKVDFTDLDTREGLFAEYYYIIKKEEGFELRDICAAVERLKIKKKHQSGSDLEEYDEEEDQVSDYDGTECEKKRKRMYTKKRSQRAMSAVQTHIKSNKKEFIGWASRSLIEFLSSIGKSTHENLSQRDVTSIINDYVKQNKLLHPEKRKMIMCDARLHSLFWRRTISKNKVYDLLEPHFAENYDESEEDELGYDSEDENVGIATVCKRQRKLDMENESPKTELGDDVSRTCFASIVVENIKLVYLKRSLLVELLQQPETFEEKVVGCFVRVKSDRYDYRSRCSHRLMQVEGVKTVSNGENDMEAILLFSDTPKEIAITLLADDDPSKEECEDLRQKMVAGQLKRPTVGDLQQKAKLLHEDITKHWIKKQLSLLPKLIDRANEKGWRREFYEFLEKKTRLQTASEVEKLLGNVPSVIPDLDVINSNFEDLTNDMSSDKGSAQSIVGCNSLVPNDEWQDGKASEAKRKTYIAAPQRKELLVSEGHVGTKPPQPGHSPGSELDHDNTISRKPLQNGKSEGVELQEKCSQETKTASKMDMIDLNSDENEKHHESDDLEIKRWFILGPNGEQDKCSLSVLRSWSEKSPYASKFKVWKEDDNQENAISLLEAINTTFPKK